MQVRGNAELSPQLVTALMSKAAKPFEAVFSADSLEGREQDCRVLPEEDGAGAGAIE